MLIAAKIRCFEGGMLCYEDKITKNERKIDVSR